MDKLDDGRSVIVTGPAGSGKSGVLRTAARRRRKDGLVYFLDARELSGVSLLGEIPAEYRLQRSIADTLDRLSGEFGRCLFVVDQLDNVRGGTAGKKVREMLRQVNMTDNVQVLCACRAWDIDEGTTYDVLVDSFTRYGLEPLRENVVREVLVDIGVAPEEVSSPLVKLGRNLLNLSLSSTRSNSHVRTWRSGRFGRQSSYGTRTPSRSRHARARLPLSTTRVLSTSVSRTLRRRFEPPRSRSGWLTVSTQSASGAARRSFRSIPTAGIASSTFFPRGVARIPLRPEARWCTLHPRDRRR